MGWRLAESLVVLRNEANKLAPNRSKISDGTIGDQAHTTRNSDHNPDEFGVVRALDLTHDSANGANMHIWSEIIRQAPRHPSVKYIIWNARIASDFEDWNWRVYNGTNPHTKHMHISVRSPYDLTNNWNLDGGDELANSEEIMAEIKSIKNFMFWGFHPRAPIVDGKPNFNVPAFDNGELGRAILVIKRLVIEIAKKANIDVDELAKKIVLEFMEERNVS